MLCKGRAMEKLAEERKGPSSMEYKKRQMLAALQTLVQVHAPIAFIGASSLQKAISEWCCHPREQNTAMTELKCLENVNCARSMPFQGEPNTQLLVCVL